MAEYKATRTSESATLSELQRNLHDNYVNIYSIVQELLQNADDAGATRVHLGAIDSFSSCHGLTSNCGIYMVNDGPVEHLSVATSVRGTSTVVGEWFSIDLDIVLKNNEPLSDRFELEGKVLRVNKAEIGSRDKIRYIRFRQVLKPDAIFEVVGRPQSIMRLGNAAIRCIGYRLLMNLRLAIGWNLNFRDMGV